MIDMKQRLLLRSLYGIKQSSIYRKDKKSFYSIIGRSLTIYRKRVKMTQRGVAKELGVKPATINDYEKGRVRLPLDRALILCDLFNIGIYELISGGFE